MAFEISAGVGLEKEKWTGSHDRRQQAASHEVDSLLSKNGGTEALTKRIPPRTMGFPRDAVSGRSRSSPSAVQDPRGPTPGSGGPRPIPEGSPANPREPRKRSWTGVILDNALGLNVKI